MISRASWSTAGRRLATARLHGNAVQVATIAPNGSDARVVRRLTDWASLAAHTDDTSSMDIAPLPDATRGVVIGRVTHPPYLRRQFCVVNLDGEIVGRSPEEFAKCRGQAAGAWAPDGSRIAVRAAGNSTPNGKVALHTMAPDGSDMRMLVRGGLAMVAKHSSNQDAEVGKPRAARGPWCPIRTATRGSWRTARR